MTAATIAGETAAGVISGSSPFGFLVGRIVASGVTTDVMINALEQKGIARSLAEPNLVALSGDTASFLAGGEYPIPVSGSFGQVTVDYKKYGVGLAFTPTVLGRGLINMKIEPEVSQIDTTHTVSVSNGISVPALIVRRASTTVELRDGQSFVIGGLLQSDNKNPIEQLPWLGSVPVLGALFSSKSYQKNETDLAIIVTPHLVRPARPGDEIKAPTDDTLPPNDVDFFLLGKTEVTREEAQAAYARDGAHRRRRRPAVHRTHARHAEGGIQCGHSVKRCARSRLPPCSPFLAAARNISIAATPLRMSGGNAVATNVVTHMVDPWPRESANRNIAFNGARMESAFERYRTNRVITPRGIGTSSAYQDCAQLAEQCRPLLGLP